MNGDNENQVEYLKTLVENLQRENEQLNETLKIAEQRVNELYDAMSVRGA